jgi:hypothetical protein
VARTVVAVAVDHAALMKFVIVVPASLNVNVVFGAIMFVTVGLAPPLKCARSELVLLIL